MTAKLDEHSDYLTQWLEELQTTILPYQEPLLGETTVDFIKLACHNLSQDNHVFIMACDVLEKYISIKNSKNQKIQHKVLVISSIIWILSKHIGEISDLRAKNIQTFYLGVMNEEIPIECIKMGEVEVMNILGNELPLFSVIDDLKLVYKIYLEPMNIRVNLLTLCEDILCLVYIHKKYLFFKIKSYYEDNDDALDAFKCLVTNKLYLPTGVVLVSIKLTLVKNFIDINKMVFDFSSVCRIHPDHLRLLMIHIADLIKLK